MFAGQCRTLIRSVSSAWRGNPSQHAPARFLRLATSRRACSTRSILPQVRYAATAGLVGTAAVAIASQSVHAEEQLRRASSTLAEAGEASGAPYPEIVLYQYKICPYCNKVKAVLDYLNIPYTAREVNPVSKAEIKGDDFDGYKKVPVCRIDGEQVNDSPVILGRVLALAAAKGDGMAATAGSEEQQRWIEWADRKLAVLLFPNITRSMSESMQAFSYIWDVPHFSLYDKVLNRYAGAVAMRFAQGKIKKKYNIDDEREALNTVLTEWTSALQQPFLTGESVTAADLCVFGCLRGIAHTDAVTELLASNELLREWYARVEDAVGPSACVEWT